MKMQTIRLNMKIDHQKETISGLLQHLKIMQEKLTAALKEVEYQKRQVKRLKGIK